MTDRIIKWAVRICRFGTGLAFAVLTAAVLVQVVGRTFNSSPVWTEELTRYALLYLIAFGAGLALRTGDLVNVDAICEALPGKLPWMLRLFAATVTLIVCVWLLAPAMKFVSIGTMQTSPALGVKMNFVHFSVYLLLALLTVFAGLRIIGMLTGTENGLSWKPED